MRIDNLWDTINQICPTSDSMENTEQFCCFALVALKHHVEIFLMQFLHHYEYLDIPVVQITFQCSRKSLSSSLSIKAMDDCADDDGKGIFYCDLVCHIGLASNLALSPFLHFPSFFFLFSPSHLYIDQERELKQVLRHIEFRLICLADFFNTVKNLD